MIPLMPSQHHMKGETYKLFARTTFGIVGFFKNFFSKQQFGEEKRHISVLFRI